MGVCIECSAEDSFVNGPHICRNCNYRRDVDKRRAEDMSRQSLHLQEQMLSIESQRLYEQRQFQQKILEQSITTQKAFETGQKQDFYEGAITLYGDFYGLNFTSPYLTEDLTAAFFDGAFSKLQKLVGPYDDEHRGELIQQIMDIASDLNELIVTRGAEIIKRHKEEKDLPYYYAEEFDRKYRLIRKGSDGKKYCVHIAQFKLKMYVDTNGKFMVEGISPKQFCGSEKFADIFDKVLGFPQYVDQVNNDPDQVKSLRVIIENKYKKELRKAKNRESNAAFSSAINRCIGYGAAGCVLGLIPSLLMGSWSPTIWIGAIFGLIGLFNLQKY